MARRTVDIDIIGGNHNLSVKVGRCRWGNPPSNDKHHIILNKNDTLISTITKIKSIIKQERAKIGVLSILTEGNALKLGEGIVIKGVGISFGRDIIVDKSSSSYKVLARYHAYANLTPVHYHDAFRKLYGHFAHKYRVGIEFLGCAAAARDKFQIGRHHYTTFGWRMCQKIAHDVDTSVKASIDIQNTELFIDTKAITVPDNSPIGRHIEHRIIYACEAPGPWEGSVYIFYPNGRYHKIQ